MEEINQPPSTGNQNQALVTRQDLEVIINEMNQNIERTILTMAQTLRNGKEGSSRLVRDNPVTMRNKLDSSKHPESLLKIP